MGRLKPNYALLAMADAYEELNNELRDALREHQDMWEERDEALAEVKELKERKLATEAFGLSNELVQRTKERDEALAERDILSTDALNTGARLERRTAERDEALADCANERAEVLILRETLAIRAKDEAYARTARDIERHRLHVRPTSKEESVHEGAPMWIVDGAPRWIVNRTGLVVAVREAVAQFEREAVQTKG